MKHVSSERPTQACLAWFNLAEFVARGEKERALSIFRLLSHSLRDEAVVLQLEGDILQAFNDERAFESYEKAARLYQKRGEDVQALALYQQLNELFPSSQEVLTVLIALYQKQKNSQRACSAAQQLIALLLKKNAFHEAHTAITLLQIESSLKAKLHEQLAVALIISPVNREELFLIRSHIKSALDGYVMGAPEDQPKVAALLASLAGIDAGLHEFARNYLTALKRDERDDTRTGASK